VKIQLAIGALVASCLLTQSIVAAEDDLEIKGFHSGMKRYELTGHLKEFCYREGCALSRKTPFTVGGVKGRFLTADYNANGEADAIEFVFDSLQFAPLQAALTEKYPQAVCQSSEAIARSGIKVPQVMCRYETSSAGIYLLRVAGNINRSVMFVLSAEKRQEVRDRVIAATRDL
jgi:hypothetical protein